MKIIDLNILLYAVNKDAHHHHAIRQWWEEALAGEEPIGLCWLVLLGFLRLATIPKCFPSPCVLTKPLNTSTPGWRTQTQSSSLKPTNIGVSFATSSMQP